MDQQATTAKKLSPEIYVILGNVDIQEEHERERGKEIGGERGRDSEMRVGLCWAWPIDAGLVIGSGK